MLAAKTLGDVGGIVQRQASEISPLPSVPPKTSILVVDYNYNALHEMRKMMRQYRYEVTMCTDAEEALQYLKFCTHEINMVIWELHMPKIDGIEALKIIDSKMDIPVLIMSDDDETATVMEATINGACYFVTKPVEEKMIANMWQHIVRRKMTKQGLIKPIQSDLVRTDGVHRKNGESQTVDQDNGEQIIGIEVAKASEEPPMTWTGESQQVQSDLVQIAGLGQDNCGSMNITQDNGEENTDTGIENISKKKRMVWNGELQKKFLRAIDILGGCRRANPKKLLKCLENMNVEGLTRTNVASHLQKHRLHVEEARNLQQSLEFGWPNEYIPSSLMCRPNNDSTAAISSLLMNHQTVNPIQENPYPNGYLPMNNNQLMTNSLPPLPNFNHDLGWSNEYRPSSLLSPSNVEAGAISSLLMNAPTVNPIQENPYPNGYLATNKNQFMTTPLPPLPSFDHELLQQQQHQSQQQYGQLSHELDYAMNMKEPEQPMGTDDLTNLAFGTDLTDLSFGTGLTDLAFGTDLANLDLVLPSSPF